MFSCLCSIWNLLLWLPFIYTSDRSDYYCVHPFIANYYSRNTVIVFNIIDKKINMLLLLFFFSINLSNPRTLHLPLSLAPIMTLILKKVSDGLEPEVWHYGSAIRLRARSLALRKCRRLLEIARRLRTRSLALRKFQMA